MKKITGKVVSLVLALALVVSSFSANFAFAATKSMAGEVTKGDKGDIYLCAGGKGDRQIDLNAFLVSDNADFKMKTKNHKDVDSIKVSSISHLSGDRLVSLKLKGDDDSEAYLRLRNTTKSGTEEISVLFKADYSDEDGVEYTVKAQQKLKVHVYKEDQFVLGKYKESVKQGEGIDDLDDLAMTAGATVDVGLYTVKPQSNDSAYAAFTPATNVYYSDKKNFKDSGFVIDITSGSSDIHFLPVKGKPQIDSDAKLVPAVDGKIIATIGKVKKVEGVETLSGDASTSNLTFTAKKIVDDGKDKDGNQLYKASTKSDDKYTFKGKILKKVDIEALKTYTTGSNSNSSRVKDSNYEVKKDAGRSILDGFKQFDGKDAVVTDKEIHFPDGTESVKLYENTNVKKITGNIENLIVGNCTVGTIDFSGDVTVDEGKVGDITVGDGLTTKGKGKVTVTDGAKVGNIKTTDADDNIEEVVVDGATTEKIESDGTVEIKTTSDDKTATVGEIKAAKVLANADEAKISISGIKPSVEDAEITLYNTDNMGLTINKIDFDSYDGVKLNVGGDSGNDDIFTGTIPAPVNAQDGRIEVKNKDTNVTFTGKADINTVSVDSDSTVTFKDDVKVKTIEGDGMMVVAPGKLYIKESTSSVKLKLDGSFGPGTVALKADAGNVNADDFSCYGFTLDKSTASGVDTFKVKSVSFAGVQINKSVSQIAKGYSETFTASAYPNGTSMPKGYTVKWDLDNGSTDVFSMTTTDNTATVKVNGIDSVFPSQNHTTLIATLYDADGYEVEDYSPAKCDITATAVPAATIDTTRDFSVAQGASYQFKVTSTTTPSLTVGTQGIFNVALASKNGNDYFYKITAVGKVGSSTGVYLNGVKVCVVSVKAPAFTCDTNKDITVKGSYQLKVTATATPTFSVGTAGVFKASFVKKVGNDYFYKLTSAGKAGAKAGIFVNGVKVFVATVG